MGKLSNKMLSEGDSPNSTGTEQTQVFSVDENAEIIIKNSSEK